VRGGSQTQHTVHRLIDRGRVQLPSKDAKRWNIDKARTQRSPLRGYQAGLCQDALHALHGFTGGGQTFRPPFLVPVDILGTRDVYVEHTLTARVLMTIPACPIYLIADTSLYEFVHAVLPAGCARRGLGSTRLILIPIGRHISPGAINPRAPTTLESVMKVILDALGFYRL
jgi:hypothetical protein